MVQEQTPELADSPRLQKTLEALEASTKVTQDAGERIARIAERLRQFIHLDESERKSVNIPDLLRETLSLLKHQFGQRIKVHTSYDDQLPQIDCNPRRMSQVFHTIIQNAAESIEVRGTISISAKTEGREILIRISDTGRGIAPDTLDNIFDVQLSPGQSRVHAAMGLPICRSVVRRHGGSIAVQSVVGQGSTFSIRLPLSGAGSDRGGAADVESASDD
jgi:two-component system NtrC family sensor kinase